MRGGMLKPRAGWFAGGHFPQPEQQQQLQKPTLNII